MELLKVLSYLMGWKLPSGWQVASMRFLLKLQLFRLPKCCPWMLLVQMLEGLVHRWLSWLAVGGLVGNCGLRVRLGWVRLVAWFWWWSIGGEHVLDVQSVQW